MPDLFDLWWVFFHLLVYLRSLGGDFALTREEAEVILQLNRGYTRDDISKAYRRLAKEYHPDVGGDTQKFIQVKRAYDLLISYTGGATRFILTHHTLFTVGRM